MAQEETKQPGLPTIDVLEYGGKREGTRQSMDRRLFMQLLVFDAATADSGDDLAKQIAERCAAQRVSAIVYADLMDPRGVGLLTWSEDPGHFLRGARSIVSDAAAAGGNAIARAATRPSYAMVGRTYATGHEPDLEWSLLRRPIENVTNEGHRWHVWYPLRRTAAFARLDPHDQSQILREHANIGMAYGAQELAHDVRLACYGLDAGDNEFVIGLVGRDLQPLSHLVQAMRKTRQTSEFIEKMGPFFVGYAAHRVK
jgi:Chlorite dismutase